MSRKKGSLSYCEQMRRPCLFPWHSDVSGRDVLSTPSVDCDRKCEHCGWNPAEMDRRIAEGRTEIREDPRWGKKVSVLVFPSVREMNKNTE